MKLKVFFLSIIFVIPIFFLKIFHSYDDGAFNTDYFYKALDSKSFENTVINPRIFETSSFSYLAEGTQSVAFISQDQKYILKFFFKKKFKSHRKTSLLDYFSITGFFNKTLSDKKSFKNYKKFI